jgi:hypothetical protein
MAYRNTGVFISKARLDAYNYPTYRYCSVCEIVNFMNLKQADQVRSNLEGSWSDIIGRLMAAPPDYGFSEINYDGSKPMSDFHEGPAVAFPEFDAKLSYKVKVKPIATVCVPPHHSKLWARISYETRDSNSSFDEEGLDRFYAKAAFACEKIADLLAKEYMKALKKVKLKGELVPTHEIRIETTSSNLDVIEEFLRDDTMRMSSVLKDQAKFDALAGFLSRVNGKKTSDCSDLNSDIQWFKVKVSKAHRENLIGIYSKKHEKGANGKGVTKFVGLVNEPFEYDVNCITREFSKKLVQHIAPVI